jgi:L,D-transpeptidase ErfK/SrfK
LNKLTTTRHLAAILLAGFALSGCAALDNFLAPLGDNEQAAAQVAAPVVPIEERPRLDPLPVNYFVLASEDQTVIGETQVVFTREENTFSDLAREYGLGYDELVEANPDIDPWLPGEGTPVVLPTQYILPDAPREGIVLNIASKRLFYYAERAEGEDQVVMTYPIGIGRVGWETPLGSSSVVSKARDPHWYVPASVRREHEEAGDPLPAVVPPGPENPLGRHVLKLGIPGYLIHGTNQPYGVGMRVSHGCVRLYPENIETLYELVGIGVPVAIVNQPFLVAVHDGDLYFEAHKPLEDDKVGEHQRLVDALASVESFSSEHELPFSLEQLRIATAEARGTPVRLEAEDAGEFMARARVVENTVVPDPDMPTLAEVRAILDEPLEEPAPEASVDEVAVGDETDKGVANE